MKGKKSFLLYADLIHTFEDLSDEEAGKLIKIILDYVNDKDPKPKDKLLKIIFTPIKLQLKRDLEQWQNKLEARREAGRKGGLAKSSKTKQSVAKQPVNDNVNVNDNDNVIDYNNLLIYFNKTFKKKCRVFPLAIKNKYKTRLKDGYTIEDIKKAMLQASKDSFHQEHKFKYCTLEYFTNTKTLDRFVNEVDQSKKSKYIPTI